MIVPGYAILCLVSIGILPSPSEAFTLSVGRYSGSSGAIQTLCRKPRFLLNAETDEENGEGSTESKESNEKKSKKSDAANDILNSPVFLKRKLEVLQNDLAKVDNDIEEAKKRLEEGKAEWGSKFEDLEKEYKNIQQRLNAQSNKSDDQAVMQVARQMLEVLDNFDRAFGQVTVSTDAEKDVEAEYRKVYDKILETFTKLGVEEIKSVGTEFDYAVHQAVMQKPSDEYEEGIVCEELQKGFKIGDTLIRASMVVVAA